MIAILDVDYRGTLAVAAGVIANGWMDAKPQRVIIEHVSPVEDYQPGEFYRRELPCLLKVLGHLRDPLSAVVVDGYAWLGEKPGLGARLYEALGETVPVVGVAKTHFHESKGAIEVLRGTSTRPLYVTAAGMAAEAAADLVRGMHGDFRLPTLLKEVDGRCRGAA